MEYLLLCRSVGLFSIIWSCLNMGTNLYSCAKKIYDVGHINDFANPLGQL